MEVARNNAPRIAPDSVCIQGALRGAYSLSMSVNPTSNTGKRQARWGHYFVPRPEPLTLIKYN